MKIRCILALLSCLIAVTTRAEDASGDDSVDTESVWVTSIAPLGGGEFAVGTATGLLLRPGTVSKVTLGATDELAKLYEHPAAVWDVVATAGGKTIASVDYQGNLVVFDAASKKAATHEKAFERWCQTLVLSPDDKTLLAGNESGKLFHWSLADAKIAKQVELGGASLTSIAFSPTGSQVAVADGAGKVHLLKYPELESVGTIPASDETAWCVAYLDNNTLLVGSSDQNVYQVAAKPDAKPKSIARGTDWITRIAVSSDGQVAASEVSGAVHLVSGGAVTSIGADSGVWALEFVAPGQLIVGTRKHGLATAGQSWTWKALPAPESPKEEATENAGDAEANAEDEGEPKQDVKEQAEGEKPAEEKE
jgi:WD40 repeat protein